MKTKLLKPCPFCGSDDVTFALTRDRGYDGMLTGEIRLQATCKKSWCETPNAIISEDTDEIPQEAIIWLMEIWNTRSDGNG